MGAMQWQARTTGRPFSGLENWSQISASICCFDGD